MSEVVDRVRVARAEPRHAAACAAIMNDWIDATEWMPRVHPRGSVEWFVREVVFAMRRVWVALQGNEPVGFLALDAEGTVTALYVADRSRGQGIGRFLLNAAKSEERALELWTFQPNARARAFYSREGFRELRRTDGDNEEGVPDVLMRWEALE